MPDSQYEFKPFKYSSHDSNWIIRLGLFFKKFDYMDRGILERTHLRSFTLQSLEQLMDEVCCEVHDVIPTPLPIQLVLPFIESKLFTQLHDAHYALKRCWKTFLAYQFVIVAALCYPPVPRNFGIASAGVLPAEKAPAGT